MKTQTAKIGIVITALIVALITASVITQLIISGHHGTTVGPAEKTRTDNGRIELLEEAGRKADGYGDRATAVAPDQSVIHLQEQLEQVQEALSLLAEHQAMTQEQLERFASEPQSAQNDQPPAPEPSAEDQAAQHARTLASLQSRLEAEAVDGQWASDTISRIENSLQHSELTGIQLTDARCGATLCRLEMALPADEAPGESLGRLSVHRGWDGATTMEVGANGEALFYIARTGYDLEGRMITQSPQ